jgi:hypothetical protein
MDREHHRARLAETIAWASLQPLNASPDESEEIKRRRGLLEHSFSLSRAAYALESKRMFGWLTRRKAKGLHEEAMRLLKEADPESIEPLTHQLRSKSLAPDAEFAYPQTEAERHAIVQRLCEKRAALLQRAGRNISSDEIQEGGGRILLYAGDENVCDGASKYSSKGYFDAADAPPWDSWVCFDGIYLVCWVPPVFLGPANAGIDVNPVECIKWADDLSIERIFGPIRQHSPVTGRVTG